MLKVHLLLTVYSLCAGVCVSTRQGHLSYRRWRTTYSAQTRPPARHRWNPIFSRPNEVAERHRTPGVPATQSFETTTGVPRIQSFETTTGVPRIQSFETTTGVPSEPNLDRSSEFHASPSIQLEAPVVYSRSTSGQRPGQCAKGQHIELSEYQRNKAYVLPAQTTEPLLCDDDLTTGWYRLTGAAGDRLTTECPAKNTCGSLVPLWMRGTHPAVEDGLVWREVCGDFVSSGDCCDKNFTIAVINCGPYYIYRLSPIPSCAVSYCGEDAEDPQLELSKPPVLTTGPAECDGQPRYYICGIHHADYDLDLRFEVTWLFDGRENPEIDSQIVADPFREVMLLASVLRNMETKLSCRARMFYARDPLVKSPYLTSNSVDTRVQLTTLIRSVACSVSKLTEASKSARPECLTAPDIELSEVLNKLNRVEESVKSMAHSFAILDQISHQLEQLNQRMDSVQVKINEVDTLSHHVMDVEDQISTFISEFKPAPQNCKEAGFETAGKEERKNDTGGYDEIGFGLDNLVFTGIEEKDGEDTEDVLKTFLNAFLAIPNLDPTFVNVTRLGDREVTSNPRQIVAAFARSKDREMVFGARYLLCGTPFRIDEFYPESLNRKRKVLSSLLEQEDRLGKRVHLYRDSLFVDNIRYYVDEDWTIQADIGVGYCPAIPQCGIDTEMTDHESTSTENVVPPIKPNK